MRDNVDILAGFVLTPNAMAAGDVSTEAKKFMVVMNAASSVVTERQSSECGNGISSKLGMSYIGDAMVTRGLVSPSSLISQSHFITPMLIHCDGETWVESYVASLSR